MSTYGLDLPDWPPGARVRVSALSGRPKGTILSCVHNGVDYWVKIDGESTTTLHYYGTLEPLSALEHLAEASE